MKIAVFNPKGDFKPEQLEKLSSLGTISYVKDRKALALTELIGMAKNVDIIACDPDPFGGFEKGKEVLTKVMEKCPNLKGVCLSTTSYGWIDLDYCKKRKLPVSNVPGYSKESVAESSLAFLIGAMKRIFVSDRRTQIKKYKLEQGFEVRGKTLGIIGLGNIGSRVADLAMGVGMNVIAYNRSKKSKKGVKMVSLNQLFKQSDAITLHTTHEESNELMISRKELSNMKKGVFIVNTVDRALVNEKDMAQALKSGQVDTYVYEGEDLEKKPLAGIEKAIGFKGFAWYTKEAFDNLYAIMIDNIVALAKGKPQNRVI